LPSKAFGILAWGSVRNVRNRWRQIKGYTEFAAKPKYSHFGADRLGS